MNLADLNKVANAMVAPGKGILAADESSGTIKKRFDAIKVESTEDNRRDYREMLFRSQEAMSKYISGVILYDETIWQNAKDGTPLVKLIEQSGAIPGIKVDEGTQPLPNCPGELITVGLDKLAERLQKYYERGARFARESQLPPDTLSVWLRPVGGTLDGRRLNIGGSRAWNRRQRADRSSDRPCGGARPRRGADRGPRSARRGRE